jgi:hypothetical protein
MPRRFYPQLAETRAPVERPVLSSFEHAPGTKPSPFSQHLLAQRRGFFFMAAAIALIAPLAVAARHAEAEMTLAHCWPLDLSIPASRSMLLPDLRVGCDTR